MKEGKTEICMDLFSQNHMRIHLGNNLRSFNIAFGIDTDVFGICLRPLFLNTNYHTAA